MICKKISNIIKDRKPHLSIYLLFSFLQLESNMYIFEL
jgi:hypothetical protein